MVPISETMEAPDAQEERAPQQQPAFLDNESGYRTKQVQSPQTVGYALTASAVGQAAWLYEKYGQWTNHNGAPKHTLSRDEVLENTTLY